MVGSKSRKIMAAVGTGLAAAIFIYEDTRKKVDFVERSSIGNEKYS